MITRGFPKIDGDFKDSTYRDKLEHLVTNWYTACIPEVAFRMREVAEEFHGSTTKVFMPNFLKFYDLNLMPISDTDKFTVAINTNTHRGVFSCPTYKTLGKNVNSALAHAMGRYALRLPLPYTFTMKDLNIVSYKLTAEDTASSATAKGHKLLCNIFSVLLLVPPAVVESKLDFDNVDVLKMLSNKYIVKLSLLKAFL